MRIMDKFEFQDSIHMARQALIKARIARQKATIAKDWLMYEHQGNAIEMHAQALLDEAKALRNEARDILLEIERGNGRRVVAGLGTFPLKDYLSGKFFRAWREFDVEYASIGLPFRGVDPE